MTRGCPYATKDDADRALAQRVLVYSDRLVVHDNLHHLWVHGSDFGCEYVVVDDQRARHDAPDRHVRLALDHAQAGVALVPGTNMSSQPGGSSA